MINLSRRDILRSAGGLLLGFAFPISPEFLEYDPEGSPNRGPDGEWLGAYVCIDPQGVVTLRVPASEMGQGVHTALPMILAEELDLDLAGLKQEGFEAVFMALGLPESRKINLDGAGLEGVLWGLDFLSAVRDGRGIAMKDRVLVIGGGNVAVDVALTTRRLGAKEVIMACLESRQEMPANVWEVRMALEEGVRLMPSWGPKRVLGENGHVAGIELISCTAVFDAQGCFCPQFDDRITLTEQVDQVILAVGQSADLSCIEGECCCDLTRGVIEVDSQTQGTSLPGVFAGGDMAAGPGTIIQAIASGKRAACHIDKYLGGDGIIEAESAAGENAQSYDGARAKGFADLPRMISPTLPVAERLEGFKEVDICPGDDEAIAEANRCLQCDLEFQLAVMARNCVKCHS